MQKTAMFLLIGLLYTLLFSIATYLRSQTIIATGLTAAGLGLGFILPMFLDVLIPKLMDGSAKAERQFAQDMLKEGAANIVAGNVYTESQAGSPLRSYPLLFGYALAAIFVLTSTNNWFGRGVVLGLGFALVLDLVASRKPADYLRRRWFSVFHTRLTDQELQYFVWGCAGLFVILSVIGVFV